MLVHTVFTVDCVCVCVFSPGMYLSDLTYIDSAYPSTGSILENEQRSNLMNNILRIISDLQRSCEYGECVFLTFMLGTCITYLQPYSSIRWILILLLFTAQTYPSCLMSRTISTPFTTSRSCRSL